MVALLCCLPLSFLADQTKQDIQVIAFFRWFGGAISFKLRIFLLQPHQCWSTAVDPESFIGLLLVGYRSDEPWQQLGEAGLLLCLRVYWEENTNLQSVYFPVIQGWHESATNMIELTSVSSKLFSFTSICHRASGLWDASVLDQYLTSLNWSFAMLGVGLSQIRSTNTLEIAFFVIVAFRSLMTYATLVSSITSLTSALSKIKEDETSEFRLLRSYMAYNNIGAELSHKVSRFLQHQYHLRQEAKSAHANVPLLDLLSPTLRRELEFARNSGSMEKLDFISGLLSCELNQSFFFGRFCEGYRDYDRLPKE